MKEYLFEIAKGESMSLVSEAPGYEFEVECKDADTLSVAQALSDGLAGAYDEEDERLEERFAELFDNAAKWQKDILREARPSLSDRMHEVVEDVIAEGIADRLMPLFGGRLRAVILDFLFALKDEDSLLRRQLSLTVASAGSCC